MTPENETEQRKNLTGAYTDHEKGLNLYAFFKLQNHGIGEDLVQDTFVKTWRYLVRGGKIELMRAFLYHVLNGLIIDEYRKHKPTSLDALREKGFEPSDGNSSTRLFGVLDGKAALLLIQRLPRTYQAVMRMRYVQDLSLNEISILTGQTKNTVAVQAHRGLEKLKILYGSTNT